MTMPQNKDIPSLKIAHLISLKNVGGIERLYSEFINYRFREISLEHHTLLAKKKIASVLAPKILQDSASIYTFDFLKGQKIPKWLPFFRLLNFYFILKKIKPDIILLWSKAKIINKSWLSSRTKVVFYEHGVSWMKNDREFMSRFFNSVDGIICNSHAARKLVEKKWNLDRNKKITVCLNAIRPKCSPVGSEIKKIDRGRQFRLGCAGRLVPLKGIALVVNALDILKKRGVPCELWIAGTGEELPRLQKLVTHFGLDDQVKFLGFIDNMSDFFSAIDCFVCPSIREPFGLVCAEAMAHGCPVIASLVDGIPEVVQDGHTGFCIQPSLPIESYGSFGSTTAGLPKLTYNPVTDSLGAPKLVDPAILADRIQKLYSDSEIFENMSRESVTVTKKKFSFDSQAACIENFLQNIVK